LRRAPPAGFTRGHLAFLQAHQPINPRPTPSNRVPSACVIRIHALRFEMNFSKLQKRFRPCRPFPLHSAYSVLKSPIAISTGRLLFLLLRYSLQNTRGHIVQTRSRRFFTENRKSAPLQVLSLHSCGRRQHTPCICHCYESTPGTSSSSMICGGWSRCCRCRERFCVADAGGFYDGVDGVGGEVF
jgi:hypothetical protein